MSLMLGDDQQLLLKICSRLVLEVIQTDFDLSNPFNFLPDHWTGPNRNLWLSSRGRPVRACTPGTQQRTTYLQRYLSRPVPFPD